MYERDKWKTMKSILQTPSMKYLRNLEYELKISKTIGYEGK